ncbi:DNA cytosine methyltransferase [Aeromonas sp. QDB22]|jgi:DNA (cytosine-5)-methyltransferase 1|uniref:DNA cytosine methyltransferase n=1 Tax=Aeromonas sp. QDB22 TaxID=2989834 RepID=UPI0022E52F79|nr:DNA cytosine methyltransferase [Aeromonas sp. QDB22]
MNAIDLFSGLGGWSTGAVQAGCKVLWAANHWKDAVHWHSENHPETLHICQDLHQADWAQVPDHDLLLASPCCQGHSKARGKKNGNPQHDGSRSTAWAVINALEYHLPPFAIVENVPDFLKWSLYPSWELAMKSLGYSMAPHIVNCADLGVPQERLRLFIVCTRSANPIELRLPTFDHVSAASFIDLNAGRWSPINKPGRAKATLERIANGRAAFGERFLISYYGNTKTGRSLDRPIGTITTRDRWAVVNGDRMRILTAEENLLAMSFPSTIKRPEQHKITVHMAGNAVPPLAGQRIIEALMEAA